MKITSILKICSLMILIAFIGCVPILENMKLNKKYRNDPFFNLSPDEQAVYLKDKDLETKFYYHVGVIEYYRPNVLRGYPELLVAEDDFLSFAVEKLTLTLTDWEVYGLLLGFESLDYNKSQALSMNKEAMNLTYDKIQQVRYSVTRERCESIYEIIRSQK